MSWVAVAVVGGSVITGAASYAGSKKAGDAAQRGADAATAESSRQFDLVRADTAPLRSVQRSSLDTLASLYGWAPPSQAAATYGSDAGQNLILDQGGVPAVNAELYANDPAYRHAWDKTLAWEKANRPGWRGQETYWAKATNEDWTRLNELMARNLAEYRSQNPQAEPASGTGKPNMDAFFESPDYQYNLEQSEKAINRAQASTGRFNSGRAGLELTRNASGMASAEYGNFVNRLLATAGLGTTGVTTSANAGMTSAGQIGAAQQNAGNARASSYMAGAQGINNAVQGGISNYLLSQYLQRPGGSGGAAGGGVDPYGYYNGGGVRLS